MPLARRAGRAALLFTFAAFCCAAQAYADPDPIDFGADYTQDFLYNAAGGLNRGGGAPGIVHFNGTFDSGSGNVVYADMLGTFGGSISNQVGDRQGVSNVAAHNTFKLYKAWYQHSFGASGVSARLGLQDYAALFNMLGPAQLFLNSSFGTDPTISQVAPSIFPTTALGAVVRWQSASGFYAMGGVYDGVPGEPGHPAGTHIAWHSHDGAFSALELGLAANTQRPCKVAVGGWYRSTDYVDALGRPRSSDGGVYAIGSVRVAGGPARPATSLFLQVGRARGDRNPLHGYVGAGVTVAGPIAGRPDDTFGFGVARAATSDLFRRVTAAPAAAETAIELSYQAVLTPRFVLQPDVQYVVHPGGTERIDNAWVIGMRVAYEWP
ncbi:MAG TPA: carbohydrate porin [Gammaproteobacteria bacterium]|nr:carbohydrate porin [Gammaproteobacteria bacterium]